MNPYLKVFLGTVIPLGIFTGTALSASAGQVRIELLDVKCGNTEDVTGEDEFYIVGALSDGISTNTKGVLTTPIGINDGQTKTFPAAQQVIFNGYVLPQDSVRGGLKAFDEDFAKDWSKYGPTVNAMGAKVIEKIAEYSHPYAVPAAVILGAGLVGFNIGAYLDEDDELGKLELNVPAIGPNVEERTWRFRKTSSWYNPGWSTWDYTVRYRITRF